MIRSSILALALTLLASASPAFAQSEPDGRWLFEVGTATDNRSKDVSKTRNDGHVFGSATWESADRRFYAGPAFEGVQASGSNVELSLNAGFAPEAFGFEFDFNVAYLNRVGAEAAYDEDAFELTADMRRAVGPAWGNLQVQYAPDPAGPATSFVWVEAEVGWEFTDRLSASAAIGRREQDGAPDYAGWNAGVTWEATRVVALDLRWHDTDAGAFGEQYEGGLVASVIAAF